MEEVLIKHRCMLGWIVHWSENEVSVEMTVNEKLLMDFIFCGKLLIGR